MAYLLLILDMEQAEALLSQLRAKGLDRVNLVLNGFLTGGSMKNAAAASRLSAASGSRKALDLMMNAGREGIFTLMEMAKLIE